MSKRNTSKIGKVLERYETNLHKKDGWATTLSSASKGSTDIGQKCPHCGGKVFFKADAVFTRSSRVWKDTIYQIFAQMKRTRIK